MSNIEVVSAIHGIAPRSDELLRLGTDLERGRVSQQVFNDQVGHETINWLETQSQAGIDLPENGKLHWQDHLRPIVKASIGFAPDIDNAPVTRWFEDNRFYRRPTITGRLRLDRDRVEAEIGPLGHNVSLLSPRSFAYLCIDNYPDLPAERNVVQLYSDLFFFFEQKGVKRILLEDYLPDSLLPTGSLEEAQVLADWCGNQQLSLLSPGKQSGIPYSVGRKLGVSVETAKLREISGLPDYRRPNFEGSEVWQQVLDASHTRNDVLEVGTFPVGLLRLIAPARLVLTNTVDLECLPLSVAQDKVKRLGEFALELQEQLETNE